MHHWQAPTDDIAEAEAPAQEQAAVDEMCLGSSWAAGVDRVKAFG